MRLLHYVAYLLFHTLSGLKTWSSTLFAPPSLRVGCGRRSSESERVEAAAAALRHLRPEGALSALASALEMRGRPPRAEAAADPRSPQQERTSTNETAEAVFTAPNYGE